VLVLGSFVTAVGVGSAQTNSNDDLKSYWRTDSQHEFREAARSGIGFSFAYDGKPIGPILTADWQVEGDAAGRETAFRHCSGLTAIRSVRVFPQFAALEYAVRFRNDAATDLPSLSEIQAIDLTFDRSAQTEDAIVTCGGGGADANFPPKDFAVAHTVLVPPQDSFALGAAGGKPSAVQLPFFLVENRARDTGLFVGIGWTGQWQATVRADRSRHTLSIRAGVPGLDLRLRPGEEVSGPTILLGSYRGPLRDGTNVFRRLIRDCYAPTMSGQAVSAPVLYTTWFDIGAELNEELAGTLIDRAAEIGQEVFLVDAGWYRGTPSARYKDMRSTWEAISQSLGNWEQGAEPSRFPGGLKPLAERVRARGMKFGLWFEPERAGPQSLLAREHPEWVVATEKRKWLVVDLGRPAVQEYFCKILDRYIGELGIGYVRWDMNHHDLLPYWEAADTPGRRGLAQIRYVEGLHRMEDHIRRNHPDVILESCTGGGNRIDLTTLQRRHTIWVSDQNNNPPITLFHLAGLNQFIPGNAQGVSLAISADAARQSDFVLGDLPSQVCFGGAFGLRGRLHEWSPATRQAVRRQVEVFKRLRGFLSEDFYLLEAQPRTLATWTAWQFHNPRTQAGFVQAFRLQSPDDRRSFVLHGLDPDRRYQFTDPCSGERFVMAGGRLTTGLPFELPMLSSRVLLYSGQ
jgi:alpha-galactosidase